MLEAESDIISYEEVLALVNKTISRQKKPPKEKKVSLFTRYYNLNLYSVDVFMFLEQIVLK